MRTSKWWAVVLVVALGLMALAASGCEPDATAPEQPSPYIGDTTPGDEPDTGGVYDEENTVTIRDREFDPPRLEVQSGDTVTWVNEDSVAHDVDIDGVSLGTMNDGDMVTWTADAPGTYPYICPIHPEMSGEIIVR